MILQINDLPTVHLTVPKFMCFVWHHLGWFLGLAQISFVALLGASDAMSPGMLKMVLIGSGVITAVTGYVKAHPPPSITDSR